MDVERALISKTIHAGQIEKIISLGIEPHHFHDPEVRVVFEAAQSHLRRYRAAPSLAAIRKHVPDFSFDAPSDPVEYLAAEFIKQVKRRAAITALRDLAPLVDDPKQVGDIDALFLEKARELARVIPSTRVARFSEMEARIRAFEQRVEEGEPPGIPMGIPMLDHLTLGVRPHEFVSIAGWQGTGKSTLMLHIFFSAYMAGKTPMIISLEMESESIFNKLDTMATNFEARLLEAMKGMPDAEKAKWEEQAERAKHAANDIIVLDDLGRCTVDKVFAETVRYAPDMVAVDYVSLLDGPKMASNWEKLTVMTRELKMQARILKIPLFAVAQTNIAGADQGATLETIAYSRSIGQDSDIVLGLHSDEMMQAMNKMEVRLLKNRRGKIGKTFMYWEPEYGKFREWGPQDIARNRKEEPDGGAVVA